MSAPFPEQTSRGDSFGQEMKSWRDIPERGTFIPSFYDPDAQHPSPGEVAVGELVDGAFQPFIPGFTVAEVAPEHRWAIRSDGAVLEQHEFERRWLAWKRENWVYHGVKPPQGWTPGAEPCPSVRQLVHLGVDPQRPAHLKEIHADPNATQGATPEHFYDPQTGEPLRESRIEKLVEAWESPKLRETLKPGEVREVMQYMKRGGGTVTARSDTDAKLTMLTEMLHDGDISREAYIARVEALTGPSVPRGTPEPVTEPSPEPEPETDDIESRTARCGQVFKNAGGRIGHEARSKKCKVCNPEPEA